jgi:hypothetical protein
MSTAKTHVAYSEIQETVDEYIKIDAQAKKLTALLKKMRKDIEPHMVATGLHLIEGTRGGSISLEPKEMAITTANFSSYSTEDVIPLLDAKAKKQCIVRVVDRDALEHLVKMKQAPADVLELKQTKSTLAFTIRHE